MLFSKYILYRHSSDSQALSLSAGMLSPNPSIPQTCQHQPRKSLTLNCLQTPYPRASSSGQQDVLNPFKPQDTNRSTYILQAQEVVADSWNMRELAEKCTSERHLRVIDALILGVCLFVGGMGLRSSCLWRRGVGTQRTGLGQYAFVITRST